jgi:hypothetical protein
MHANGKMIPVETVPALEDGRIREELWMGKSSILYLIL